MMHFGGGGGGGGAGGGGLLDWNSDLYRRIMGKTLKIFFSETARPTPYRFMSWIIYVISALFLLCFRARPS